jgi:hypothetical protein
VNNQLNYENDNTSRFFCEKLVLFDFSGRIGTWRKEEGEGGRGNFKKWRYDSVD